MGVNIGPAAAGPAGPVPPALVCVCVKSTEQEDQLTVRVSYYNHRCRCLSVVTVYLRSCMCMFSLYRFNPAIMTTLCYCYLISHASVVIPLTAYRL